MRNFQAERTLRIWKAFLSLPVLAGLASCTFIQAQVDDLSSTEIAFIEPSANSYSNDTGYSFKVQINSSNKNISADNAKLQIFEGPDCAPSNLVSTTKMSGSGDIAQANSSYNLEDGKKYSARIVVQTKDRTFQSVCSSWVGIDTQNPNPVGVTYPVSDGFNSNKEMLAVWTSTTDNGISGLSEVPYRLRLFGQAACGGAVLQKVDSVARQYKFKSLTQGMVYSVQVSSVDKAGNESVLACSPYTEIDINVPGFKFVDPTSIDGYSRVTTPQVQISNDSQASYWCFTPDTTFIPTSYTDPCPSGSGTASGWYTSRPSTVPITSGDGLKNLNLWIVRSDGTLVSLNPGSGATTLDQTPPGTFAVTGVGGLTDTVFDDWFTGAGQPQVKWAASADAVDYTVDIRTNTGTLVCSQSGVTVTDFTFNGCPTLTNGATYRVRIKAFDIARNDTTATDYNFVVDRDPPGAFSITGITGAGDTNVDAFVGTGNPTVNYGSASSSSHYRIRIDDNSGTNICSIGSKVGQSGVFNYASESGVVCAGLVHGSTYRAYVSAFDDGENETVASNNGFSFQVDVVNPVVTLGTVPAAATSNTFANFTFTSTDALSGVFATECQLDGGGYATCASPHNLTGLAEGSHTLNVRVYDRAGNSTTQSHTWIVDLTNPVLTIDSQPAAYVSTTTNSITFHATDASGIASITCKVDGGSAGACTSAFSTTLAQGSHTVVIRATDNVGYYDEKTVSFVIDTTNPSLALTVIPANPSHGTTSGTVEFTMSDTNPISATCQIDGGAYATCTSPATFTGLTAGTHTINVRATDAAGNFVTQGTTWIIYTYAWSAGSFAGCTAAQPTWSTGAFGSCSVGQPNYSYSGWGTCPVTCGGGWQYQTATCNVVNGTQTRTVSCPVVTGTEARTVVCKRSDNITVLDSYCDAPSKPATTQACSRGGGVDCSGLQPSTTQPCSRGGGTDCASTELTAQQCNTHSCGGTWVSAGNTCTSFTHTGAPSAGTCPSGAASVGQACASPGYVCTYGSGATCGGMVPQIVQLYCQ